MMLAKPCTTYVLEFHTSEININRELGVFTYGNRGLGVFTIGILPTGHQN